MPVAKKYRADAHSLIPLPRTTINNEYIITSLIDDRVRFHRLADSRTPDASFNEMQRVGEHR